MSAYDLLPCTDKRHVSNSDCPYAHDRLKLEAKMIRGLIRGLKAEGWLPTTVYTDGYEAVSNETQTMDAVFSVDESTITFSKGGHNRGVLVILGNGVDCIPDWNVSRSDEDGWNAAMDRITMELYEKYED